MIQIILHKDYQNVQVVSDSLGKLDKLLTYMKRKIHESIGHYASVLDLYEWVGVSFLDTNAEMKNWVWTNLEKAKIDRDFDNYTLSMPPARKRGMINPNLHQIMEEKYYPLTPPPQPYKELQINIPRACDKTTIAMNVMEDICRAKTKLEVYDELSSYSYRIEPAPIKMPTREEIAAAIIVYQDYNIDVDAYKFCYMYKDRVTDHTFHQMHVMNRIDHILEDENRLKMWDKEWREELISAVMKAHESKKKEQEKEKLKMYVKNVNAIDERIRRSSSDFTIEGSIGSYPVATIKCPLYSLDELFGFEDNSSKKPKPVSSVTIANIEMYNDRVVKVTFDDGSFTKSVCQENDIFDLDVGITVCLMKKMLDDGKGNGTRIYNDIIRGAHKLINDKENEKIEKQMEKEKQKKKAHKAIMKKQAKKMKAKEEAIDIQKQAFIRAMQETGMTGNVD